MSKLELSESIVDPIWDIIAKTQFSDIEICPVQFSPTAGQLLHGLRAVVYERLADA